MQINKFISEIERWSPPGVAWEKDNVGLQVGSAEQKVKNIFLCLELTEKALDEAIKKKCNFIFTHHPFIFKPLKRLNLDSDPKSQIIKKLIQNNITLYSAHTNLDFTKHGVSYELAKVLDLKNIDFLVNAKENQFKVAVFVPKENIADVANSVFDAGGGVIGEYGKCSFRVEGIGTFEGSADTNPAVGSKENFENAEEARLEVLVDKWNLNKVIKAMIKAHPYEEVAYDVYPLMNSNVNYGFGAIGELKSPSDQENFLAHVCKSLKTNDLRFSGESDKIKKVAVCGGSGSDLLNAAISQKADAFITADVKYHTFQDGEDHLLFIDAGHYETEIHSLKAVRRFLKHLIEKENENIEIFEFSGSTNPIKFYNYK